MAEMKAQFRLDVPSCQVDKPRSSRLRSSDFT